LLGVQQPVVEGAREDPARDVGVPCVLVPPVKVVNLAVAARDRAAVPEAPLVARDHGAPLGGGEEADAPTEVEGLALSADHEPRDLAVAQQTPELGRGKDGTVLQTHRWRRAEPVERLAGRTRMIRRHRARTTAKPVEPSDV